MAPVFNVSDFGNEWERMVSHGSKQYWITLALSRYASALEQHAPMRRTPLLLWVWFLWGVMPTQTKVWTV